MISSASSLDTASFTTFGALSTRSFASFNPSPVISRTTLITLTLEAPAATSSTSNSVFSSAAAASPPAAATTTPAAADTPNSSSHAFTNSFNSNTDNSLIASINSAVVNLPFHLPPYFVSVCSLSINYSAGVSAGSSAGSSADSVDSGSVGAADSPWVKARLSKLSRPFT